jgi:hypothetical protein
MKAVENPDDGEAYQLALTIWIDLMLDFETHFQQVCSKLKLKIKNGG